MKISQPNQVDNAIRCLRSAVFLATILCFACSSQDASAAQLQPKTASDYDKYVRLTEQRIAEELRIGKDNPPFLTLDFSFEKSTAARESLKRGEIHIEKLRTRDNNRDMDAEGGLIHHWVGAVFIPGVKLDTLQKWLTNYAQHERYFPDIERSKLIADDGRTYKFFYRLKRKKVITVVYNTDHTANYFPLNATRMASKGVATRIAQIADAGTAGEKELPVGNDGGYLWRLNSYWRFEEKDGGVYVECESISLSRDIPFGVGWMIRGLVESVPRESLVGTLTALRDGVRKGARQ
jgi:hypothetical protein